MKTLTRQEVRQKFKEITLKYGIPKEGEIYCEDQLISKIASTLCCYDEVNITYEYGQFTVSADISIRNKYAEDHIFIGTVKQEEWYTKEQIKIMHEIGFGYQF